MSMTDTVNRLTQSFSDFWEGRNARERTLLGGGAAVVVLGLVYALLIDPAISGRERLNKDLPQMRAQVAQLQVLAREAAGLASATPQNSAPITKESMEADLARRGLKADSVAVSGEIARLQLSAASFAALVEWLDEIQKSALVSVLEANIIAQAQPDTVNATLTLRQQKGE